MLPTAIAAGLRLLGLLRLLLLFLSVLAFRHLRAQCVLTITLIDFGALSGPLLGCTNIVP